MHEERLLKRISTWQRHPHRRSKPDPQRAIDSVLEYVQKLLNTKQGNAPIGDDFGMPDYAELLRDYPDSLRDFERSIRQSIQKYEPRLQSVRVKLMPNDDNPFVLRFQITARLASQGQRLPVVLESTLDNDGRMTINY